MVKTGDVIQLDGPGRTLNLLIEEDEWQRRRQALPAPPNAGKMVRGYQKLYYDHVLQADKGCDLDFLVGSSGSIVERESH